MNGPPFDFKGGGGWGREWSMIPVGRGLEAGVDGMIPVQLLLSVKRRLQISSLFTFTSAGVTDVKTSCFGKD